MFTEDGSTRSLWTQRKPQGTRPRSSYRFKAVTAALVMASASLTATTATSNASADARGNTFQQRNLVSDRAISNPAQFSAAIIDPAVINPWGIAMGPTSPLWVNNMQFSPNDLITLYQGATSDRDPVVKLGLEVKASAPTGIVFNPTSSFKVRQQGVKAPATFLFNENVFGPGDNDLLAKLTGWSNASSPLPTVTKTKATKAGSAYTGLALVPGKNGPRLLAADNITRTVDIYDGRFRLVHKTGALKRAFVDPNTKKDNIPPYNVTFLKGRVYVTYADFNAIVPGSALSVFTPQGKFIKRLVQANRPGNPLDGPWGMAIAPEHWGHFGGAILVGNVVSGQIQAYNRRNGHLLGTLKDAQGNPLVNVGLWGLAFGNGKIGTPRTLLFAAGIGNDPHDVANLYTHGLVGLIKPVNDGH
jgi:uncharacterized protein (TIGR03118 family)